MKKVQINNKLTLDKMSIAKLNNQSPIVGGWWNPWTVTRKCSIAERCQTSKVTASRHCNEPE